LAKTWLPPIESVAHPGQKPPNGSGTVAGIGPALAPPPRASAMASPASAVKAVLDIAKVMIHLMAQGGGARGTRAPGGVGISYTFLRRRRASQPKPSSAEPSRLSEAGSGTVLATSWIVILALHGVATEQPPVKVTEYSSPT